MPKPVLGKRCRFCGNKRNLIKAHIIPAGFFRRIRKGKEALEIITNTEGEYKKRSQTGIYDRNIICAQCETIWQKWDNYAQCVLAENLPIERIIYKGNKQVSYGCINTFRYDKLKLFFISLIWRASISGDKYYKRILLGNFEDIAKQMIENTDPGNNENFSVVLSKLDYPIAGILDPYLYNDKESGIQFCRIYLGSYIADIKIDHSPTPKPYSYIMMTKDKPLCILYRNFIGIKEFKLIKKLLGISPA